MVIFQEPKLLFIATKYDFCDEIRGICELYMFNNQNKNSKELIQLVSSAGRPLSRSIFAKRIQLKSETYNYNLSKIKSIWCTNCHLKNNSLDNDVKRTSKRRRFFNWKWFFSILSQCFILKLLRKSLLRKQNNNNYNLRKIKSMLNGITYRKTDHKKVIGGNTYRN